MGTAPGWSFPQILVADEDPFLRLLVRTTLASAGYHVLEAADGDEALTRIWAERPSLALLDIGMPGRSGFELCALLRAQPFLQEIKVVLLSGHSGDEDRALGTAVGADAYLTKPFSPRELLDTIYSLLASAA